MPGCCLLALIMFLGPRVVLACAWFLTDWYRAFDSSLLALAGWLFLPWTSLAWIYVYFHQHGVLNGSSIVLLGLGVLIDVGTFGGSHRARSRQSRD